jgi:1-acyl-sn-glycerol-3-phosphate acyltransferase
MLRLILVLIAIVPATIYHGGRMMWAVARKSPNASCICDGAPRSWAKLLLWLSGVEIVLENPEAIDPDRPQILVANHTSWYDVLAVSLIPGRYLFVAKKELASVPVFGPAVGGCGHIFIDRKDRKRAAGALEAARQRLEDESPTIIMFPEGTRSADGTLQPFKKGAFVLALQAGVDVIPAAIFGSRDVMKKGSFLIRPGTIRVRFGDPIKVRGLDLDDRNELTGRAHAALLGLQAADAARIEQEQHHDRQETA